ncbi:DUF1761 domain-containing protein [Candidatus Micrarchaeota archaeon]|nr:DUF1761 domain-containing protein [Candidatus Micrarchaeota archaeon]
MFEWLSTISVFLAAVVAMVVGYLWYSPMLFGNKWMKLSGWSEKEMKKNKAGMGRMYFLSFVAALITAFVLGFVFVWEGVKTAYSAVSISVILWIGFVMTTSFTQEIFSRHQNWELFALDSGHRLVALVATGLALFYLGY